MILLDEPTAGQVIADKSAAEVLNSPDIAEAARLKETSLFHLSHACGISQPHWCQP